MISLRLGFKVWVQQTKAAMTGGLISGREEDKIRLSDKSRRSGRKWERKSEAKDFYCFIGNKSKDSENARVCETIGC